ncbi:MAG: guanylate kinase [Ignavibacteriae bacterium]|nr:guanylate kinase [Ignavibacteriota bacterium]
MPGSKLIVISAPSGSGKTTIVRESLKRHPEILFSVSATTRPKREFEVHGKDYFFITKEEFKRKIQNDELVEWEQLYGDYYGTLRSEVDRALRSGKSMLFDVDVNGALSIRAQYPKETVLIFIKPPSMEILTQRLMKRGTETLETIRTRLERVPMELEKENEFHFCVVNDDLQTATDEVDRIIHNVQKEKK